jgi:hypothetical protein
LYVSVRERVASQACSQVNAFIETAVRAAVSRDGAIVARTEDLAADLGVDEDDILVLLRQLGEQTPEPPDDLVEFLRWLLDPHGERTAPANLFWPGADDRPRRVYGLGGPDPTASEDGG